jgi:RNA polymerase sigma factor (sigma-70 family)
VDSLETLIQRSLAGDADAYATLVWRFQDMAVGYGYSILGDFQLAEDAAQEAFLDAYRTLHTLREAQAFPGWFRRIVFKHCDRLIRRRALSSIPLDAIQEQPSYETSQALMAEQREMSDKLWEALNGLPEHERTPTVLYYVSGYSQNEIGTFLDTPVTTIKKRLFLARKHLRAMLFDVLEDSLRERRPSRHDVFAKRLMQILKAASAGDIRKVKELLEQDPRLLRAKDWLGNTALILAVDSGHHEVAELLLNSGVQPDIYEAAAIGRTKLVEKLVSKAPGLVNSYSPEGFTPLALAAHFGHAQTVGFLLSHGADINAISQNELQVTPLHACLYGRRLDVAKLLVESGADVTIKRGGNQAPRAGWTALHYSAGYGFVELIDPLLRHGADVHARDNEGRTALRIAIDQKQEQAAEILRRKGSLPETAQGRSSA